MFFNTIHDYIQSFMRLLTNTVPIQLLLHTSDCICYERYVVLASTVDDTLDCRDLESFKREVPTNRFVTAVCPCGEQMPYVSSNNACTLTRNSSLIKSLPPEGHTIHDQVMELSVHSLLFALKQLPLLGIHFCVDIGSTSEVSHLEMSTCKFPITRRLSQQETEGLVALP